jgi:hypothetical protein
MNDRYLAQARLPSNSGWKTVQLRLKEVEVRSDDSILLMEIVAKGEMVERGKKRRGDFVTDFEWAFPQQRVSLKALGELHAAIRRSLDQLEPFAVSLGVGECVLNCELAHSPDGAKRGVADFTIVCGVTASQADCTFGVDHSCLLELAEGLEHMAAFMHQA